MCVLHRGVLNFYEPVTFYNQSYNIVKWLVTKNIFLEIVIQWFQATKSVTGIIWLSNPKDNYTSCFLLHKGIRIKKKNETEPKLMWTIPSKLLSTYIFSLKKSFNTLVL